MKKITLNRPLVMGEREIHTLELREPTAGDCRGISLMELFSQMNPEAYIQLLPRITTPSITVAQGAQLSLPDLTKIMQALSEFFERQSPKAEASPPM